MTSLAYQRTGQPMDYYFLRNNTTAMHNSKSLLWLSSFICIALALIITFCTSDNQASFTTTKTVSLPQASESPIRHSLRTIEHPTWQSANIKVNKGDTLDSIFKQQGLNARLLQQIMNLGAPVKALQALHPGQTLKFIMNEQGQLEELFIPVSKNQLLVIRNTGQGFEAKTTDLPITNKMTFASGTITGSLYLSAKNAGLSKASISQLSSIFGGEIDFAKTLRKGDTFNVVYEKKYLNGKHIGNGDIIAAEIKTHGKTYAATRYIDPRGKTHYYSPKGMNLHQPIERYPLHFAFISSTFSLHRYHPILHIYRPHYGVDLAAVTGTPIHSTANGRIIFIGKDGGYGNAIKIRHNRKYTMIYGHMSRFAKHMHHGTRVHEGQLIGYVGQTGLATGPHLHYEVRIYGKPKDPLKIKLPHGGPIKKTYLKDYLPVAQTEMAELNALSQDHITNS